MKTINELVSHAKSKISEISVEEAENALASADLIIDCRESEEFASGHIEGAVHASRGMLEFKLSNIPDHTNRDLNIIIYCNLAEERRFRLAHYLTWVIKTLSLFQVD